jgi:hypothetical protein
VIPSFSALIEIPWTAVIGDMHCCIRSRYQCKNVRTIVVGLSVSRRRPNGGHRSSHLFINSVRLSVRLNFEVASTRLRGTRDGMHPYYGFWSFSTLSVPVFTRLYHDTHRTPQHTTKHANHLSPRTHEHAPNPG